MQWSVPFFLTNFTALKDDRCQLKPVAHRCFTAAKAHFFNYPDEFNY